MRQIVLALTCLATFAMAQNVLAIAPAPITGDEQARLVDLAMHAPERTSAGPAPLVTAHRHADTAPPVSSTALLLAGLAGLTVAGGRRERLPEEVV